MCCPGLKNMGQPDSRSNAEVVIGYLQNSHISFRVILDAAHYLVDTLVLKIVVIKIANHNWFLFIRKKKFEQLSTFFINLTVPKDQPLYVRLIILNTGHDS